jgi:dihydroflavonol-4-reductase
MRYSRERGLPAVVMNVSNPYGPRDWQPTPHGGLVELATRGLMPWYLRDVASEVVGVEDVADAMLLAGSRGTIGRRYIISERYLPMRELYSIATDAVGVRPPWLPIPVALLSFVASAGGLVSRLFRRDSILNPTSLRLLTNTGPADHSRAVTELGWNPRPIAESIRQAAVFYRAQRSHDGRHQVPGTPVLLHRPIVPRPGRGVRPRPHRRPADPPPALH